MRCKINDHAEVIGGVDGINKGKMVQVMSFAGVHTQYGPIWMCQSSQEDLITEYGAVGSTCHFADDWLKPIPKPALPLKVKELEST